MEIFLFLIPTLILLTVIGKYDWKKWSQEVFKKRSFWKWIGVLFLSSFKFAIKAGWEISKPKGRKK